MKGRDFGFLFLCLGDRIYTMTIIPEKRLFWFLKEGITLDLDEPSVLDMYVQQVLTRGRLEDAKLLLKRIDIDKLIGSLRRINRFLPTEVREFWEDFIECNK